MYTGIHSHVFVWIFKAQNSLLSRQNKVVDNAADLDVFLRILNLYLSAFTILWVNLYVKELLNGGWRALEQIISDGVCLELMVVVLVGVKLDLIMEALLELRTVTSNLYDQVLFLTGWFKCIELFKCLPLYFVGINFLHGSLHHRPGELTG